jgi:hypothetical protein
MQNELTEETPEKVGETTEDIVIDNEEKEYVFYFDLYKLEGADVFNAFKNAIDKELGYKNIKYTLKQANTKQEDDAPKLMTGGASNATFPYNIFENSVDNIRGVGEEERKSIFDGLFTRNEKTEDVPPETSTPITSEEVKETSVEPKKKGFFNFDFGIINIFKKSEKVDIKPTVTGNVEDNKEKDGQDDERQEEDEQQYEDEESEKDDEAEEEEEAEDEDEESEEGDDEESEEEGEEEEDDKEDSEEDVSKELIEGTEMKDENNVNDIINENIITVELTIKCIDKKLCMPIILDIKKTMFMK